MTLGGVTEVTRGVGSSALAAAGESMRTAQQFGADVVRAAAAAAAGSLEMAQRAWREGAPTRVPAAEGPRRGSRLRAAARGSG